MIAAAVRHESCFSITARQDSAVRKAIATIEDDAWTAIKYTNAIFDEDQQRWISDAEVAEIDYTAFTSRAKADHVSARLIVRRVPDANPAHQSELFTVYRYHAVFTNSPLSMIAAEKAHRGHAIVEQVSADLKNGPLAHLAVSHQTTRRTGERMPWRFDAIWVSNDWTVRDVQYATAETLESRLSDHAACLAELQLETHHTPTSWSLLAMAKPHQRLNAGRSERFLRGLRRPAVSDNFLLRRDHWGGPGPSIWSALSPQSFRSQPERTRDVKQHLRR